MVPAVVLIESDDHVCFRYRWQPYEAGLAEAGWQVIPQALARGWRARLRQFRSFCSAGLVVLQRKLLPVWQLRWLRRCACRLVFDFDDAVFLRDSYARKGLRSPTRQRRFRAAVGAADLVIAGNRFLADAAVGAGARLVRVVPTAVDAGRYPIMGRRHECLPQRRLELVWIGSRSTVQSFERARALFEALGAAVPNLALRVICDASPRLGGIEVVARPWSAETEARELAAGDIGISWMPDDDWSRGKCGLKVLQYMAAALPVVANPVGVQAEMVRPGENGFLAATPEEWIAAIRRLASDPALGRRMGAAGRRMLEERYSVGRWEGALVECLRGVSAGPRTASSTECAA